MARIFSTPESEQTAKAFMHDITVAGSINTKNLRSFTPGSLSDSNYRAAAAAICDELINRNFTNIDQALSKVTNYYIYPSYHSTRNHKRYKPESAAKAVVYMAELLQLYWDDTIRTPYEVNEFKKTVLGAAVYKYGRVISAIKDKTTSRSSNSSNSSNSSTASGSTRTPGQPPKNDYKQRGPLSGNVRDLKGQPGQKVAADTSYIYKIVADKVGQNTPTVFIKPLSSAGAAGSTNKIFISSGKGYGDCICYFDDPNDAQAFLDRIIAAGRVPLNINNIHVVKSKAHPNGYFLVGTEFGLVAVSAQTLNEALSENAKVAAERPCGWEKATEGYSKEELEELHTWMRRG